MDVPLRPRQALALAALLLNHALTVSESADRQMLEALVEQRVATEDEARGSDKGARPFFTSRSNPRRASMPIVRSRAR